MPEHKFIRVDKGGRCAASESGNGLKYFSSKSVYYSIMCLLTLQPSVPLPLFLLIYAEKQ